MTKHKEKGDGLATLPTLKELKEFWLSLKTFLFATSLEKSKYFMETKKDLEKQVKKPVKFAIGVIIVTLGFFGVWGGLAPLDSAIMANGSIVLSGDRQMIQSEGGIIKTILVDNGDIVKAGQPLIELLSTQAGTAVNILLSQLRTAIALEKRLLAEENNYDAMDFTSEYLDLQDPEVARLISNQTQLFNIRNALLKGKLEAISKQIIQGQEKIKGENGQLKAVRSQLVSARANVNDAENLFKKEVVNKLYVIQSKNDMQRLEGSEAQIKASIAITEQGIIEARIQLLNNKNDFLNRVEEEYKQNHILVLEAEQKYLNAKETLERTVIKSPVDGVVSSLVYHTIGGLISPGIKIMEITPQNDDLIIDALVAPNEAHTLRVGMPVKIQLIPYKARLVPRIDGEVIYVSANTMLQEQVKQEFFLVKVKINREMLDKLNADVTLYPGMPVTLFMIRGTRTFLQYLLSPIIDSFHHAFKEV